MYPRVLSFHFLPPCLSVLLSQACAFVCSFVCPAWFVRSQSIGVFVRCRCVLQSMPPDRPCVRPSITKLFVCPLVSACLWVSCFSPYAKASVSGLVRFLLLCPINNLSCFVCLSVLSQRLLRVCTKRFFCPICLQLTSFLQRLLLACPLFGSSLCPM